MAGGRARVVVWLVVYWAVQAAVVFGVTLAWFGTFPEDGAWYTNPVRRETLELVGERDTMTLMLVAVGVITAAQACFVMPVRRPGLSGRHGRSLRVSLVAAGLAVGALVLVSLFGVHSLAVLTLGDGEGESVDLLGNAYGGPEAWFVVVCAVCWAVPTALLIAFVRRGRRETVLARIASRVLIGTAAEVALLIPLDVMVRRKTECYCAEGTFWGLTLAGWAGVFAAGPAVFLPLLAKRRKRWYGGHCAACGYDMSSTPNADRCPECGVGWRGSGEGTEIG